jgi:aldehyde:ferredoxin oxidoreductase
VEWLQAITGFGVTREEVEKSILRWTTMARISLLASGWTYKDDVNPPRFYEPLPEGPYKGMKVDKVIEDQKKQAYYKTLGWDTQGVPTTATLKAGGFEAFDSLMAPLRARTT